MKSLQQDVYIQINIDISSIFFVAYVCMYLHTHHFIKRSNMRKNEKKIWEEERVEKYLKRENRE